MRRVAISGIAVAMLFLAAGRVSQAAALLSVVPGSDYLTSIPRASSFPGLGSLNGVPATGNTDTIVQRQADAVFPGLPTTAALAINIALSALHLETAAPVNFAGKGVDNYFVTLQSARGGPAFLGSVTRGALIVTGPLGTQAADSHTGKTPNQMDLFPFGAFQEAHPNGAVHAVQEASGTTPTPEPATSLLIGVGLLGLAAIWKRKRR
jgi:PEP-CTERM motif